MKKISIIMISVLMTTIVLFADNNNSSKKSYPTDAFSDEYFIEKAYEYIDNLGKFLNIENPRSEFIFKDFRRSPLGSVSVRFQWFINGVLVKGSRFSVTYTPSGLFGSSSSGYIYRSRNARKVDTTPSISKEQAMAIAENHSASLRPDIPTPKAVQVELCIHKFDNEFKLAWFMYVAHNKGIWNYRSYEYYVDAKTGEVLSQADAFMY